MPRLHVKIREDQKKFIKSQCKLYKQKEAVLMREILDFYISNKK